MTRANTLIEVTRALNTYQIRVPVLDLTESQVKRLIEQLTWLTEQADGISCLAVVTKDD
jgi:uncharacterized protein YceH (UPF0502 family)